jgi:hypothetical protein
MPLLDIVMQRDQVLRAREILVFFFRLKIRRLRRSVRACGNESEGCGGVLQMC